MNEALVSKAITLWKLLISSHNLQRNFLSKSTPTPAQWAHYGVSLAQKTPHHFPNQALCKHQSVTQICSAPLLQKYIYAKLLQRKPKSKRVLLQLVKMNY